MDDLDHTLDLLGRDGSRTGLFTKQVHYVGRKFVACLRIEQSHNL